MSAHTTHYCPFFNPLAVEYSAARDLEAELAQSLRRLFRTLTPAAEASEIVEVRSLLAFQG